MVQFAIHINKAEGSLMQMKSNKGIFIEDKNSPACLVYFPDNRKVMKHRLVKFMSNVALNIRHKLAIKKVQDTI